MKFKVGDLVLVTGGKDKGKQGKITRVLATSNTVVVAGVNMYVKHIKPVNNKAGERTRKERALPTANIAIINDLGVPDRIGIAISKDGKKERIFKKTGKAVPVHKKETK